MTAAIYMEVVEEIDKLNDERAEIATRWAKGRQALDRATKDGTPPSKLMDMEAALQQLSRERDLLDHRLIVATNRRKAMDRDRAGLARSGLVERYGRQAKELARTIATLAELDARMGRPIPDCAALGRLFIPSWAAQPCSSTGGLVEYLDIQGLAMDARREADLLLGRVDADVVEAKQPA